MRALALVFGMNHRTFARQLHKAGVDTSQPATMATAFAALEQKFQRDEARARRQKAEADIAEMKLSEKCELFVLKSDVRPMWEEAKIEMRRVIQSQPRWESGKLLVALSKIKLADPR